MDVKYIGGDAPWTLPFGDHFSSSSYLSFNESNKTTYSSPQDIETIARRHDFEPLYTVSEQKVRTKPPIWNNNSQWMNAGVLFTDKIIDPNSSEANKTDFSDDHAHTFCYLCSINQHHHETTKPRHKSQRKKLIPYNNPKALRARSASLDRIPPNPSAIDTVPYRFIVRTSTKTNAGTRAQVFLYMYGTKQNWTSINLHARTKGTSDGFPTGSIRTFCLRGPEIGHLERLNINLVGARSDKEWFLKEIEITNLNTSVTWLCEFNCWLPKKHDENDDSTSSSVKPRRRTVPGQPDISHENLSVYILQVRTGGKAFAGTDSNIHVSIRGTTGQTQKLALTSNRANLFEQNQIDTFAIVGWNLGDLTEINVESDKSHVAADWDLKEMAMWRIIPNEDNNHSMIYFPFNKWLGKSISKLKAKAETYSSTDHQMKGPICYQISVKTGKAMGAGTDANVFISIYGKSGRTGIHHLDNSLKNDFESNTTSEFTIMDIDVGKIERIKVWHDNTGIGAAWLLDFVTIRKKYSTCRTIADIFVQRLEKISQVLYRQAYEQLKKDHNLQLNSSKENEARSSDRRSSKSKDFDDFANSRSILRSPIINDKASFHKKVTWDEQSFGSQDDAFSINTKRMKNMQEKIEKSHKDRSTSPLIETGHFEHHAYWISTHACKDKKWDINSIEEINPFNLDQATRNLLLSDRASSNSKIKTPITEKDDDVYEFEAKAWLDKSKGDGKTEIFLTPKHVLISSSETTKSKSSIDIRSDSQKQPSSSLSKALSDYRLDKSNSSDLKRTPDRGSPERSPRSLAALDRLTQDSSKTKFDDTYTSSHSDKKYSTTLKPPEESFMDKYHRSSSPSSNTGIKIPSAAERQSSSKTSYEPAHHSRSTASPSIDARSSMLLNQYLQSPRFDKESMSPSTSHRDSPIASTLKSKSIPLTNFDISSYKTGRSQVYSSAYGTLPTDNFN